MSNTFNLLQFVQFLRRNIKLLVSNKNEDIISGDPYTKFNWVSTDNGHSLNRISFTKYRDHVHYNVNRRLVAYTLYFQRVNQFQEIRSFFDFMGEDPITSAKNLIAIICVLLNNSSATDEEVAQSIDETFIRKKRLGIRVIWLDGIKVNEDINVNNEWHLRPIQDEDLTYEYYSYSSSNDSIYRAIYRAKTKIEIPFNVDLEDGIPKTRENNLSVYKIISFLQLYNIGGVEVIRSYSKINSIIESSGDMGSTTTTKHPIKTYNITKSEESGINVLWQELKEILPPSAPPYELFKKEKAELKDKILQNKNLSELEVKQIQLKLYLDEAKFKPVWISQAIYSRFSFASPSDEERVHHLTSSLETVLVLDKNDTSYKFKTRGAGILHLLVDQSGSDIFRILGTMYDVRSKYAHGGRIEKLESIETSNKYGPIYVRNLILLYYLYIRDRLALNAIEEEKVKILGTNFQSIIEHSLFDKQKRVLLEQFVSKYLDLLMPLPIE